MPFHPIPLDIFNFHIFFSDDGTCKHVVCLLFTLASFWENRKDNNSEVCTDVPMVFTKPRKQSEPVPVVDLDYRQNKSASKKNTCDSYKPVKGLTDTDIKGIQDSIAELCRLRKPDDLLLTLTDPPPAVPTIHTMQEWNQMYTSENPNCDFITFISQNMSPDEISFLENISQTSPMWKSARVGRITASLAKEVVTHKHGDSLVNKILGRCSHATGPAIEHGVKHEPVARIQFISRQQHKHKNFKVAQKGIYIDNEFPCLGASPDGIISCSCHDESVLEIKCTYKFKDILPGEIPKADSSYHFYTDKSNALCIKPSSPWFFQTQFQMGVTGLKMCHLVVHTMRDIAVICIPFDAGVWENLKAKSLELFNNKVIPALMQQ